MDELKRLAEIRDRKEAELRTSLKGEAKDPRKELLAYTFFEICQPFILDRKYFEMRRN